MSSSSRTSIPEGEFKLSFSSRTSIPEGDSKMPSSSRTSSPEGNFKPLYVAKRRRAQTESLLGKNAEEIISNPVDRPEPLQSLEDYTPERIRTGLQYACFRLSHPQRKLSPLGERAMSIYKEACKDLLELEKEEMSSDEMPSEEKQSLPTREELVSTLRTYEREMAFMRCMSMTHSQTSQEMQDEIIKLKQIHFYARYGDYFAEACTKLKMAADNTKVLGHESLRHKYWTDIQDDIVREKPAWKKVLAGEDLHVDCPVHMAISGTCENIGFSMPEMLSIVEHYATRNKLLHTNLELLIKDSEFHVLAQSLYADLISIPTILPLNKGEDVSLLSRLIKELIGTWFIFREKEIDKPGAWNASKSLQDYQERLENASAAKDIGVLRKQMSDSILASIAKRQEEEAAIARVIGGVGDCLTVTALHARGTKRVSSSQLVPERERLKRQQHEWNALKNMAHKVAERKDAYIEEFGLLELEAPLKGIVHDPRLDSP